MAESSVPTLGGGSVTNVSYEQLMASMTPNGLVGSTTSAALCYADATGRQVKLRPNRHAIVQGYYWNSGDTTLVLPVTSNSTGKSRVDRVVLRLDRNTWTVRATVLPGTAADKPVAPALQQTDSPGRYWDLPVASVTVASGSAGIASTAVVDNSYYIVDGPAVAHTTGRPAATPGRLHFDGDTDRLYVGSKASSWKSVYWDSGWKTLTAPSGWKVADGFRYRYKNGWVMVTFSLTRTGANLSDKTNVVLTTLPVGYRPTALVNSIAFFYKGDPVHSAHTQMETNGKFTLRANLSSTIKKNSIAFGQITYPISD